MFALPQPSFASRGSLRRPFSWALRFRGATVAASVFPHRRQGTSHPVQVTQQYKIQSEYWCYRAKLGIVLMSTVDVVAGEDGHSCRWLVPQASTPVDMSTSGARAAWARRRAFMCGHGQIPTPPAFGLPEPCFDQVMIEAGLSVLCRALSRLTSFFQHVRSATALGTWAESRQQRFDILPQRIRHQPGRQRIDHDRHHVAYPIRSIRNTLSQKMFR